MSRESLYRNIQTEDQAVRLARKKGFSEDDLKFNAGRWMEHFRKTGETIEQIEIYEKVLGAKLPTKRKPSNSNQPPTKFKPIRKVS